MIKNNFKSFLLKATLFLITFALLSCAASSENGVAQPSTFSAKDFRYGYWCGAGYPEKPNYANPSYDDIDEACKLHDKCYDETGMNNSQCNMDLLKTTKYLAEHFVNIGSKYANEPSSPEQLERETHAHMCMQLASDINSVFASLMTSDSNQGLASSVGKTINTPLAATGIIAFRILSSVGKGIRLIYNQKDRACNIE
jgi:hypothetical protein